MLNQNPKVFSGGEVYLEYQEKFQDASRRPDPIRFLKWRMRRGGNKHYVFATKFLQDQQLRRTCVNMTIEQYVRALTDVGFDRFVILERRNSLRAVLSGLIGFQRGLWHTATEAEVILVPIRLDLNSILRGEAKKPLTSWLEEIERSYTRARAATAHLSTLPLIYEEDVLFDPHIGYRKICEFMGIAPGASKVAMKRTNPFAVRDMVVNYEDLAALLEGTRFAWMLHD